MVDKEMTGTVLGTFEFPVERGKIREFAKAICDPNLLYRDREYARERGFKDVVMPMTFPASFPHHLGSENFILEASHKIGMDPARSIHGETEIFYERPVCAGECLRGEFVVGNIYEKTGKRGGVMTFVEIEIRFFDEEDKPVIVMRNLHIERS